MLKLKKLFWNEEFIKLYQIRIFFSVSTFTYDQQIEETRTKKVRY